jgi:sugar phosphate isomerase/epimerase
MDDLVLSASMACFARADVGAALRLAAELGFEAVELTLWGEAFHSVGELPGVWWREADEATRRALGDGLGAFRWVDGHLPFVDCPLVSANKFVERLGRELIAEALGALAGLGGRVGVFHLQPCPARSHDELWERMVAGCRWLGDRAEAAGLRVALETGYPVGDEFPRLLDDVGHAAVGACLDMGHLTAAVGREQRNTDHGAQAYNDCLLRLVGRLGGRLLHLHVHDVRYDDWRDHRETGTGILDFAALLARLRDSGFAGRLVFELEEPDTVAALERSKAHLDGLLAAAARAAP